MLPRKPGPAQVRRRIACGVAALCTTIVAAFQVHLDAAGAISQDVPVRVGLEQMAEALEIAPTPDRARFVAELARLTHPVADGKNTTRAKSALTLRTLNPSGLTSAQVDSVPIPLTAEIWSRTVFKRGVPPEDIVAEIVSEPRAAHLCYGLAGLDDQTLQYLVDHPALITWLYERASAAFAAFGGSLQIHGDRILAPGGPSATALWEAVVGEKVDRPELFVRQLFTRDQGRLAYLFDSIAQLDPPHAAFAVGQWMKNSDARLKRFQALVDVNRNEFSQWQPTKLPFSRPLDDIASMLSRVRVEADGAPSFPAGRAAWAWMFEGFSLAADPPASWLATDADEPIDAAWLARAIASDEPGVRGERLDQVAFGQRVFSAGGAGKNVDVLVAIRAFVPYPMLMLSLERIGVRNPAVFATAARRAQQLSVLDDPRRLVALQQYQGVLALLCRLATAQTLAASTIETLVISLSNLPMSGDGRYAGAVAKWMNHELRQAIIPATTPPGSAPADSRRGGSLHEQGLENALLGALAGRKGSPPATRGVGIPWEGQVYRLDLAASEDERLRRIRERQGSTPVDLALDLDEVGEKLRSAPITLATVSAAVEALKRIALELESSSTREHESRRRIREAIDRASEDLSKIKGQTDVQRATRIAESLFELVDEALAETLPSWAYAVSIGDADSPLLLVGDVAQRHDFGIGRVEHHPRSRLEWARPRQRIATNVPWHVTGSLLGLEIALSSQILRRVDAERVVDAPTLSTNERESFATSVALLNPFELRDPDRDAIADAVTRGRQRVAALGEDSEALEQIVAEIRMDGWRRRALQWTLMHDPQRVATLFSLTELLYLGRAPVKDLQSWGMAAVASTGCLCTRLAPPNEWRSLLGRPQVGLMATTAPDLHLHVALLLRELQLPAAIAKAVLTGAVQDFIDEARPTDANDWLGLVRAAQNLSREKVEDYVAAATAYGPLVPETATDISR
jgi:hypothetical protein